MGGDHGDALDARTSQKDSRPGLSARFLIASYVDDPRFVPRGWLLERVQDALAQPRARFVLLTGEPGSGKSALMAHLARLHPAWPRYFIRRDSMHPLEGGDARAFLFALGHQLARSHPDAFDPRRLEVVVRQRAERVAAQGRMVGIRVGDLVASPFRQTAIQVEQHGGMLEGDLVGISASRVVLEPRLLELSNLQYLALLDPAQALAGRHPEARIVILVDALDEIRYGARGEDVLSWLAACPELPSNVCFVLTSRPDPDLLGSFRRAKAAKLVELSIGHEREQDRDRIWGDLRRFLRHVAAEPVVARALKAHRIEPASFVERAVDKARGNFQYAVALARGIDQALAPEPPSQDLPVLLRLEGIPAGTSELYRFFLTKVKEEADRAPVQVATGPLAEPQDRPAWAALYHPVLAALAVALAPLSAQQLRAYAAVPPEGMPRALEHLAQFLDRLPDERYRLYHATFPEFLTGKATATLADPFHVDPATWHGLVAGRLLRANPDWLSCTDPYALAYTATHLTQAIRLHTSTEARQELARALYGLLNKEFMQARLGHTGSHRAFAEDVEQAIEVACAEQPPNLVEIVRGCLIDATIGSLTADIPPTVLRILIQAGGIGRAAEYAALVQDVRRQSEAYQHISEALVASGALDQAAAVAERIRQPWRQALARSRIHEARGDRAGADGALDEAITAAADEGANASAEVLREVGGSLGESGDAARLARRLDGLQGSRLATALLDAFVSQLVQRADGSGLRRLLELIPARPHDELKATTLRMIAPHLRLIGDAAAARRAMDTAEGIGEQSHRANALGALARAATVEGDRSGIDRVAAAAESITGRWPRLLLLGEISRATAMVGDRHRALWVAGQVGAAIAAAPEDDIGDRVALWDRVALLSRAAEMLALVGEQHRAREVIEQALLAAHRTRFEPAPDALNVLVGIMARAGRVDQAIALAQYGVTSAHRAMLLGEIAATVAPAGDSDRAAELVERATVAARALAKATERASILIRLAPVQAAVGGPERAFGLLDEAHVALDEIDDSAARAQILGGLALAWSAAGEQRRATDALVAAVGAAEALEDPQTHLALLGELLAAAGSSGLDRPQALDVDQIFELAQAARLPGPGARRVATGLARAGATGRAVAVARAPANDKAKADALGSVLLVARGLEPGAAREAIAQVRAVVGELRDRRYRSILLDHVVGALAAVGAYDEAVALAQEIEHPLIPPQSLAEVAAIAAENGHPDQARGAAALAVKALTRLGNHAARARALDHLAKASAATGDRRRAEELAREALSALSQVEQPQDSLPRLAQMSHTLAGLGMGEQAAEAAQQILQKKTLNARVAYLLVPVVRAWALLGDVTRAPEVIEPMLGSPAPSDELFEPLAEAMRFDEALALVQGLGPRRTSSTALVVIAKALLHPAHGVDVAAVAARILRIADAEEFRAGPELPGVLSHALALAGEAGEAVVVADRALEFLSAYFSYADERAIGHLLQTYARLGVLSNKVERLASAVNGYDPVADKAKAAAIIAQGFLDDDDRDDALRIIAPILIPQEIHDDVEAYEQAQVLSALSVAASRTGRIRLALDLAQHAWTAAAAVEHYEQQAGGVADKERALAGATRATARAGDHATALARLPVILSPLNRMAVLWDVARGAARTGTRSPMEAATGQADALAAEKQDLHISTAFLRCGAALVLAAAGDTRGALRHVDGVLALEQRFESSANKALVWSLVVEALVGAHEAGRAAEIAERGIAFARAHDQRADRPWALLGCARGLSVVGDQKRAADIVKEALQTWEAAEKAGDPPGKLHLPSMSHFSDLFGLWYTSLGGGRAPVILSCAALAFVDANSRPAAREAADRAKAAAQAMDEPLSRALALATAARALAAANDQRQATALLHDALTLAGRTSRQALLRVLSIGALAIAADAGEILEQTGRATLEIASWWPLTPASTSPGDDSGPWKAVISAGERRFD